MNVNKPSFKLFLAEGVEVAVEPAIRTFHEWIKGDRLGELLIDVSDYTHVSGGPGVLLTGHASDYTLDSTGGRPGLTYRRKRDARGDAPRRLRDALERVVRAARLLEREAGLSLRFRTDELLFKSHDRLDGANDDDTLREVRPDLEALLTDAYAGARFELLREGSPRELFRVRARIFGAPDLATLARRLGEPG